jgi:transcriptional regulator with XRE-family HTH domain
LHQTLGMRWAPRAAIAGEAPASQRRFVTPVLESRTSSRLISVSRRALRLYLLSSAIPYLSSVERSERNESIDNIARIAKGLQIEPWRAINPAPGDGASSYLKANYGAEAI